MWCYVSPLLYGIGIVLLGSMIISITSMVVVTIFELVINPIISWLIDRLDRTVRIDWADVVFWGFIAILVCVALVMIYVLGVSFLSDDINSC